MTQTHSTEQQATDADAEAGQGPGRRLRKARESRDMDVHTIARDLHVDLKVIQAIERDDYAELPMPVFVRGYLRSYARMVGLPAEPVLAAYDRRIGHEPPPPLVVRHAVKTQLRSSDRHVRWVTYLIVLALAALVVLWWRNEASLRFWDVSTQAPVEDLPGMQPGALATGQIDEATTQTNIPLPAESPAQPAQPTGAEPVPMLPAIPDAAGLSGAIAPGQTDVATAGPVTPPATASMPPAEPAAETGAAPDADAGAALVLEFSSECWVDIRSADGQKLLYGIMRAGDRHTLDGKSPFSLILGNAGAVKLTYRGQPVDTARYTSGNVARFSLGE